jgi:hypothetical protein
VGARSCASVRPSTPNATAHRLYFLTGMRVSALHFSRDLTAGGQSSDDVAL